MRVYKGEFEFIGFINRSIDSIALKFIIQQLPINQKILVGISGVLSVQLESHPSGLEVDVSHGWCGVWGGGV